MGVMYSSEMSGWAVHRRPIRCSCYPSAKLRIDIRTQARCQPLVNLGSHDHRPEFSSMGTSLFAGWLAYIHPAKYDSMSEIIGIGLSDRWSPPRWCSFDWFVGEEFGPYRNWFKTVLAVRLLVFIDCSEFTCLLLKLTVLDELIFCTFDGWAKVVRLNFESDGYRGILVGNSYLFEMNWWTLLQFICSQYRVGALEKNMMISLLASEPRLSGLISVVCSVGHAVL